MTEENREDWITLTIDGKEVSVPKGTFVLSAARKAGVYIPTFCEYPDLRPFGACRMCTVELVTRRGSTLDIACSSPVSEGMQVFTRSEKVREAQRFVVESLLVDHPLDCPICDKSGECDLQNNAYFSQVRVDNPLARPKQSWELEMLSESVSIKRDRCVLCGRCVRVCDELVGATALSWARRGFTSYIDAAFGEDLKQSPCVSCGLCIEVCPVGALLNTSYHDTARAWFLKRVETVCNLCSVGCNMEVHVENESGRIKRIIGKQDSGFNGEQLCARGFFGFEFVEQRERLATPMIRENGELVPTSWQHALEVVAENLSQYRGGQFGGIAGAHCTNEDNYLFGKFVRGVMQSNNLDYDTGGGRGVRREGLRDVFGSDAATNSFQDILQDAGAIMILGSNLSASHPVLSYKLQTAIRRRSVPLIVASPVPVPLDQVATLQLRYNPGTEALLLNGLAVSIASQGLLNEAFATTRAECFEQWLEDLKSYSLDEVSRITGVAVEQIEDAALLYATGGTRDTSSDGGRPASAILYSSVLTAAEGGEFIDYAAAALALAMGNVGRSGGGVNALKVASNGQGALDMGCAPFLLPGERFIEDEEARRALESQWGTSVPSDSEAGLSLESMIRGAQGGIIKAMYVMGSNPVRASSNTNDATRALSGLEFLVVQDIFLTDTARLANVVFPACAWAERDGTYTSAERRVQWLNKVLAERGQSLPDWEILASVMERMGYERHYESTAQILHEIADTVPAYRDISRERLESNSLVVSKRPGKAYKADSFDYVERYGTYLRADDTPYLYGQSFPRGLARFMPLPPMGELSALSDAYDQALNISLYRQGTNTLTGHCPTLLSLDENGAADSSIERGRGVGVVQGEKLTLAGYSTGQLTDI